MPEAKSRSYYLEEFAGTPESNPDSEYKAFCFGRVGSRSQAMITFIKKDDYVEAISYANLNRIWSSNISNEIRLDFGGRIVTIEGARLNDLFNYIRMNRCSEVIEQSTYSAMEAQESSPTVTTITIKNAGS